MSQKTAFSSDIVPRSPIAEKKSGRREDPAPAPFNLSSRQGRAHACIFYDPGRGQTWRGQWEVTQSSPSSGGKGCSVLCSAPQSFCWNLQLQHHRTHRGFPCGVPCVTLDEWSGEVIFLIFSTSPLSAPSFTG